MNDKISPPDHMINLPNTVAGAIFDFAGFLTTRPTTIPVGATADTAPIAELVQDWAKVRGLNIDKADVLSWQDKVSNTHIPALDTIEQYQTQMAAISTAAMGYWKESDTIHPNYDTPALHDVAQLYEKYDKLYKELHSSPKQHPIDSSVLLSIYPDAEHIYQVFCSDDLVELSHVQVATGNEEQIRFNNPQAMRAVAEVMLQAADCFNKMKTIKHE